MAVFGKLLEKMGLRKWEINGRIGWMNLVNYSASVEKGLGKVEIEFYAI